MIIGVALDGYGSHPGAAILADPASTATEFYSGEHVLDLIQRVDDGSVDFVMIDDALEAKPSQGFPRGRLDALMTLAWLAPQTRQVGLVPTVTTTHTEPFHVSTAVATLDFVSHGRAGWRVTPSLNDAAARNVGRREAPPEDEGWGSAAEFVEAATLLWDSWEDNAEIRNVESGQFVDRSKLHHIDFETETYTIKGPSITPRPPQGHPVTVAFAASPPSRQFACDLADIIILPIADPSDAAAEVDAIRVAAAAAGRSLESIVVLLLVDIVTGKSVAQADQRADALDEVARLSPEGLRVVGDVDLIRTELARLVAAAGADGALIRPSVLPFDLKAIVEIRGSMPADVPFRSTLRERLGLARPDNKHVTNCS